MRIYKALNRNIGLFCRKESYPTYLVYFRVYFVTNICASNNPGEKKAGRWTLGHSWGAVKAALLTILRYLEEATVVYGCVGRFAEYVRFFCGCVELFCGNIGLFRGYAVLFCGYVGLFC